MKKIKKINYVWSKEYYGKNKKLIARVSKSLNKEKENEDPEIEIFDEKLYKKSGLSKKILMDVKNIKENSEKIISNKKREESEKNKKMEENNMRIEEINKINRTIGKKLRSYNNILKQNVNLSKIEKKKKQGVQL